MLVCLVLPGLDSAYFSLNVGCFPVSLKMVMVKYEVTTAFLRTSLK